MELLKDISIYALQPVLIVGGIAWVIKSISTAYLAKDLSRFKDQLAAASKENETKFTILQTRRAEVIAELYSKLIDYMAAIEKLMSPMGYESDPPKEDQLKRAEEATNVFGSFYVRHKIYFSESV